jgi:hypothetical protein
MWIDLDTEVQARMRDRVREAAQRRQAVRARAGRVSSWWAVRQAAGLGLVRAGLHLLDSRRVYS